MVTISRKLFYFLAFLFIFSIISSIAYANGQTVFGPKECKIKWWHIHTSSHTFNVNDSKDGRIIITKNTANNKIRAGFIILNWKFIGLEDFLNSGDTVFEKDISLKSENNLTVFLIGIPDASITIEIRQKSTIPPPEVTFSADPSSIKLGESSTLSWTTTNADDVSIDQGIGSVDPQASTKVFPTETTTYTILATGADGTATDAATVTVVSPPEDVDLGLDTDEQQGGGGLVGETLRILNGNTVESRSDLQFPSPNRLGLILQAFYNSRSDSTGSFGYGWTHTYETSLDPSCVIGSSAYVKIVDQTGRAHYFEDAGGGLYTGAFNERSHVKFESGTYIWYHLDGSKYGFSGTGKLTWMSWLHWQLLRRLHRRNIQPLVQWHSSCF